MAKILFLALCGISGLAYAQTPSAPMMPDGSKDLYLGLGVASAPDYKGSEERRTTAVPLVQMQWSNGVFVSGLNLGVHLSAEPGIEYGPLLAIEQGRDASGTRRLPDFGDIGNSFALDRPGKVAAAIVRPHDIPARPQIGGFFNYYLDQQLRLTSTLLYGAGEGRDGLLFFGGVQKSFSNVASHHRLSVSAGFTWANRRYQQEFFGLLPGRIPDAGRLVYEPSAGVRDVQVTVNWNWELSNTWLLTTQLSSSRLMGQAADSPWVERRNNHSVRTGLAYRF